MMHAGWDVPDIYLVSQFVVLFQHILVRGEGRSIV